MTPTPFPTNTPSPTTGPSPTPTATPTPSPTPIPSATPLPPTATPNPALAEFSLCTQTVGDADSGRFSARVAAITTTVEAAFERITIGLSVPTNSSPPHAMARCLSAADYQARTGEAGASAYLLLLDFDDWLHDDAFRASTVTRTVALSGTTVLKNISYQFDPNAAAGATLAIDLEQPLPYRMALESNPYRLVLEVAKSSSAGPAGDMLGVASGDARPDAPLVYLQEGDIWSFAAGQATNLTNSAEVETELAVDPGAGQIAFCRAAPGADVGDALAPSELWIMSLDGSDQDRLAAPGRSCADPVFSPDGTFVAFSVDETGTIPPRLSVWVVSVNDGTTQQLTSVSDEWSRFGPQWLDNQRLVYSAVSEDGRNTLFLLDSASSVEQDIGAELVRGSRYRALGRPLAAPDGSLIAVEGLRADAEGADLVLLDANGAALNTIGGSFWTRPLAWSDDGRLFYLTSACAGEVAQDYTLHARAANGNDQLLATGTSLGGFGHFTVMNNGLAYVTLAHPAPGPHGPLAIDRASPSVLWFWNLSGGARSKLVEAQSAIGDLGP